MASPAGPRAAPLPFGAWRGAHRGLSALKAQPLHGARAGQEAAELVAETRRREEITSRHTSLSLSLISYFIFYYIYYIILYYIILYYII